MHFDNNGSCIKCASLYSYLVRVNQLLVFHSAFTNLIDLVIYNVVYVSLRIQAWGSPRPCVFGMVEDCFTRLSPQGEVIENFISI